MWWLAAIVVYFLPPSGWECANPALLSPYVQVGFIGPSERDFRPTVNLAVEEVDVGLKEYVKAAKAIHAEMPETSWRDIGKIDSPLGKGHLAEISTKTPFGDIRMLQALYVFGGHAYILTASAHKEDFSSLQKEFLSTLCSIRSADELLAPLDSSMRERVRLLMDPQAAPPADQWKALQSCVLDECKAHGSHWQFLALKEGYAKLYGNSSTPSNPETP